MSRKLIARSSVESSELDPVCGLTREKEVKFNSHVTRKVAPNRTVVLVSVRCSSSFPYQRPRNHWEDAHKETMQKIHPLYAQWLTLHRLVKRSTLSDTPKLVDFHASLVRTALNPISARDGSHCQDQPPRVPLYLLGFKSPSSQKGALLVSARSKLLRISKPTVTSFLFCPFRLSEQSKYPF